MFQQRPNAQRHTVGESVLLVVVAALGLAMVGSLQFLPRSTDRDIAAVFAPSTSFEEAAQRINNAGAAVLGVGATENIIIARLPEGTQSSLLSNSGAWLLLAASPNSYCASRKARAFNAFQRTS